MIFCILLVLLGIVAVRGHSTDVEIALHELSALVGDEYDLHSPCFYNVLESGSCRSAALSEESRVEIAVGLALCEIRTSANGLSIPNECILWEDKRASLPSCIRSLSMLAQLWTSYSGNLRQVAHLCSAYNSLEQARVNQAAQSETYNVLKSMHNFISENYEVQNARFENVMEALDRKEMSLQNTMLNFTFQIQEFFDLMLKRHLEKTDVDLQSHVSSLNKNYKDQIKNTLDAHLNYFNDMLSTLHITSQQQSSIIDDLREQIIGGNIHLRKTLDSQTEMMGSVTQALQKLGSTMPYWGQSSFTKLSLVILLMSISLTRKSWKILQILSSVVILFYSPNSAYYVARQLIFFICTKFTYLTPVALFLPFTVPMLSLLRSQSSKTKTAFGPSVSSMPLTPPPSPERSRVSKRFNE